MENKQTKKKQGKCHHENKKGRMYMLMATLDWKEFEEARAEYPAEVKWRWED